MNNYPPGVTEEEIDREYLKDFDSRRGEPYYCTKCKLWHHPRNAMQYLQHSSYAEWDEYLHG